MDAMHVDVFVPLIDVQEQCLLVAPAYAGCQRTLESTAMAQDLAKLLVRVDLDCLNGALPPVHERKQIARRASGSFYPCAVCPNRDAVGRSRWYAATL